MISDIDYLFMCLLAYLYTFIGEMSKFLCLFLNPVFLKYIFEKLIYLFLAVLSLCCAQAFSSCGASGGSSCCGEQALGTRVSVVVAHGPQTRD